MIRIVNKKVSKEDGIYIGRPSPLGNPFSHLPDTLGAFRVASREEAVERYRDWLLTQLKGNTEACKVFWNLVQFYKDFGELTLVCWCVPKKCHGEIIKELIEKAANGGVL